MRNEEDSAKYQRNIVKMGSPAKIQQNFGVSLRDRQITGSFVKVNVWGYVNSPWGTSTTARGFVPTALSVRFITENLAKKCRLLLGHSTQSRKKLNQKPKPCWKRYLEVAYKFHWTKQKKKRYYLKFCSLNNNQYQNKFPPWMKRAVAEEKRLKSWTHGSSQHVLNCQLRSRITRDIWIYIKDWHL